MKNRFAVSLIAASLLTSGAAFAQSTTAQGAANGAAAGGDVAGPVGADGRRHRGCGGRRGRGNSERRDHLDHGERAVLSWCMNGSWSASRCRRPSNCARCRSHTEYRYAVVNDRRVIVEPRTRRVIKIID